MNELLYKQEVFQLVGFCMEIHRELGKGHDEVIYKDALVVELSRGQIPFSREKNYEITYKGVILPHFYYADFVVWAKISFRGQSGREAHRCPRQTGVELSGSLKTSPWSFGQLRR